MLGPHEQALLDRAATTAAELVTLHRKRVRSEEAAQAELTRLVETKAADVARCKQRLQACEAAAAELQRKQVGAAPLAAADASVASGDLVRLSP
jgi:hypothetical protein